MSRDNDWDRDDRWDDESDDNEDDSGEWDDDDYDDFVAREFPEHASGRDVGRPNHRDGLAPHWRWTAWGILGLLAFFWFLSLV